MLNYNIFTEGLTKEDLRFLYKYPLEDIQSFIKDSYLNEKLHSKKYNISVNELRVIKGRIQRRYKKLPIPKGFTLINVPNNRSYAVSVEGEVLNLANRRLGTKCVDTKGYLRVSMKWLSEDGTPRNYIRVHRAVALTFLKDKKEFKEVNHIDGDKTNNCVENLEWCSGSHNVIHAHTTKLCEGRAKGVKQHLAKMDDTKVLLVRKKHKEGSTCASLAREYELNYATMHSILNLKTWKHVVGE